MSEPLVSVLIPVYNHAPYIERCLESLIEDGWPNLEVLVLDDGSGDNSFGLIEQWRVRHPTAFTRFSASYQTNQGLVRSLNLLLRQATGDFITLVASDDGLLSGGISARVAALEHNPKWLAVIGDTHLTHQDGSVYHFSGTRGFHRRDLRVMQNLALLKRELILRWWVPGPGLLLRKEAYDRLGNYDEQLLFEDRDMYLRLLAHDALGYVDYPVAFYRFGPERYNAPPNPKILIYEAKADRKNAPNFSPVLRTLLLLRASMLEYTAKSILDPNLSNVLIRKSLTGLFRLITAGESFVRRWV